MLFTYFKLSIFSGLILSSPVIIYQILCFIAPGLYKKEKSCALPFVLLSSFFFLRGVFFSTLSYFPSPANFLRNLPVAIFELIGFQELQTNEPGIYLIPENLYMSHIVALLSAGELKNFTS